MPSAQLICALCCPNEFVEEVYIVCRLLMPQSSLYNGINPASHYRFYWL
jgi:hypothetical protein